MHHKSRKNHGPSQPFADVIRDIPPGPQPTIPALLRALGEVIYAIRTDDGLIKIGWTQQFDRRSLQINGDRTQILGFMRGTRADETRIHRELNANVAHGREWYHATPPVLAVVNEMRSTINLDPLLN